MKLVNWKLDISYRGTNYCGWQRQTAHDTPSVQGLVENALRDIFKDRQLNLHGSGRTDAGVHALAQTASFTTKSHDSWNEALLKKVLNYRVPPEIRIVNVEKWPENLHARFSAFGKTYFYVVNQRKGQSPFVADLTYNYNYQLDLDAIKESMQILTGKHDFTAFAAKKKLIKKVFIEKDNNVERVQYIAPDKPKGNVREIYKIEMVEKDGLIFFIFHGSGFLYKMVRSLVGHLLRVGNGRATVADTKSLLANKVRTSKVDTAPGRGLYLAKVFYEPNVGLDYDLFSDPLFPKQIL